MIFLYGLYWMMNEELLQGIVFGPVPSRRLGRSLGVNNIPPKYCSYSCVYCQLGRNKKIGTGRRDFYSPESVLRQAEEKIAGALRNNSSIDYISFVPDGEPTLDINLGRSIRLLKKTGIKTAVITNSSLLYDEDVREQLMEADWVSLKADAVREDLWKKINRPHKSLSLERIQKGMALFARSYSGILATETMLVKGINTGEDAVAETAGFIKTLNPEKSYISIPTRPPAEASALPADEGDVTKAYRVFSDKGLKVECITGHEGDEFTHTGGIVEDILDITSVHPMREESMKAFLSGAGADWNVVEELIRHNRLVETEFNKKKFYLRKFISGGNK